MIRLVNGTPLPTENPVDRQRREARAELYTQHRYGGELEEAWALMMTDMREGTYDAHCREWALNSELLHPALVAWYRLHRLRPDGGQLQGFLEALQAAHDSGGTPAKMTGRFKALGIQFGLKWPKEESDE